MLKFNLYFIYGVVSLNAMWIRIKYKKYGIHIKRSPPLFSERYGLVKYHKLLFGWRFRLLGRGDTVAN